MMRRFSIYILLLMTLAVSCGKDSVREDNVPVNFSISTRAGDTGEGTETYLILAYNSSNYSFRKSGTYYRKQGEPYLVAYEMQDGVMTDAPASGITGDLGNVQLSYISPAVTHSNGWVSFDPRDEEGFYCLLPTVKDVNGYGPVYFGEDELMQDVRSKIKFSFYAGLSGGSPIEFAIPTVPILRGAGDEGPVYFHPATRQIRFDNENTGRSLVDFIPVTNPESPGAPYYKEGLTLRYQGDVVIPSACYAPKEVVQSALNATGDTFVDGNYLMLDFDLKRDETSKRISLPVTSEPTESYPGRIFKFEPKHEYHFNIMIYSTYINVTVDIYEHNESQDWEDTPLDGAISPVDKELPVGSIVIKNDSGSSFWESRNPGEQEL